MRKLKGNVRESSTTLGMTGLFGSDVRYHAGSTAMANLQTGEFRRVGR